MLGQHFLQSKAQENLGITIQPKRQVLTPNPMTVTMNTSDREHWPNKKAFIFVRALKDHALNISSPMPTTFFSSTKPDPFDEDNSK